MTRRYRYVKIRTKNHTASPLRQIIPSNGKAIVFRMGSVTPTQEVFPNENPEEVIEINTVNACKNSSDKVKMKLCFDVNDVKTAKWYKLSDIIGTTLPEGLRYPLIIKNRHSSRGNGIYFIEDEGQLERFINEHEDLSKYIIENYHKFPREYRLHVTEDGCFYTCRKMLKSDATDRWHRHDSNSVWILEDNPLFDKPTNWNDIVEESVKALNAVGLTIGAVDVKCTSASKRNQDFIILEINSAPSFGEITLQKYITKLNQIILNY